MQKISSLGRVSDTSLRWSIATKEERVLNDYGLIRVICPSEETSGHICNPIIKTNNNAIKQEVFIIFREHLSTHTTLKADRLLEVRHIDC